MQKIENFYCKIDDLIDMLEHADIYARLLADICCDIAEANKIYGHYGNFYDPAKAARQQQLSRHSDLLKALNDIVAKQEQNRVNISDGLFIGSTIVATLRYLRAHAVALQEIWTVV